MFFFFFQKFSERKNKKKIFGHLSTKKKKEKETREKFSNRQRFLEVPLHDIEESNKLLIQSTGLESV